MTIKRTPWFPSTTPPVRKGVYEREHSATVVKCSYWNGEFWGGWAVSRTSAYDNQNYRSSLQSLPWRGMLKHSASTGGER